MVTTTTQHAKSAANPPAHDPRPHTRLGIRLSGSRRPFATVLRADSLFGSLIPLVCPWSPRASACEPPPDLDKPTKSHRRCLLSHAEETFHTEDTNPQPPVMEKGMRESPSFLHYAHPRPRVARLCCRVHRGGAKFAHRKQTRQRSPRRGGDRSRGPRLRRSIV